MASMLPSCRTSPECPPFAPRPEAATNTANSIATVFILVTVKLRYHRKFKWDGNTSISAGLVRRNAYALGVMLVSSRTRLRRRHYGVCRSDRNKDALCALRPVFATKSLRSYKIAMEKEKDR